MFGVLRLLFAAAVALAHAGYSPAGNFHAGVPAVVGFYLISGYVTTALVDRYHQGRERVGAFYADRAFRLLPQYYFYMALGAALWALGAVDSPFLSVTPTAGDWWANALIAPLNYFMFTGQDRFTLAPPAWSLGMEMQFYVLLPWLILAPWRVRAAVWALSLGIFGLAQAGMLDSDVFGYRLLPGILWIFLTGGLIYRQRLAPWGQAWWPLWLGALIWGAALIVCPEWRQPFKLEVALGLSVGLPVVATLARWPPQSWDTALGHLSYGLFLGHFAVLWLWPVEVTGHVLLGYLAAATLLAGLSYGLCERPLSQWRRVRFRTR